MNVRKGRRLTGQQRFPARRRGRRRDRPSFARRNSVASVDSIEKNRLNRPTFSTQSTQSRKKTPTSEARRQERPERSGNVLLPDGEGAVGTGRASIGGIRSLQSTQSRKSTQSTDFLDSVDSIDSIEKKTPTSEARRQKRPEWSGNVLQLDGEDAVGTGRASIGGIRSLQSTQSRKSTSSIDSIEKIDSIDRLSRLSRLNRLNREKNADERSEAAKTPRMERQRSPARRRGRRRDRPSFARWGGFQPDGGDAGGTGRASLRGTRTPQKLSHTAPHHANS